MKLYYTNPEVYEWDTVITEVVEEGDHFLVQLKETAFYPEGGGQPSDLGYIGDLRMLDATERGNAVYHKVLSRPKQMEVHCKIDPARRLDHTQHHSGQHLLSAVFMELFDIPTLSFHLGEETVTIDLDTPGLGSEQLLQVENRAYQLIQENRRITTFYVNEEELKQLPLRKLPKVTEDIRIVDMTGIDVSACCGTHVQGTSQIGMIKIVKTEKYKGKTRVYFLCGRRAFSYFQELHQVTTGLASKFSTNIQGIAGRTEKLEEELTVLRERSDALVKENQHYLIEQITKEQQGTVIELETELNLKEAQQLGRSIAEKINKPVILINIPERRTAAVLPSGLDFQAGKWFKASLSSLSGKGGGSDIQAQATFSAKEDMEAFISQLREALSEAALLR
ncbi:alanyl-tRNA editing protein [Peribacillus kribbensis]|uniref:alanyl-tRNA editing protein n=1 Tax=Peribacillus kribbensis TaxID=356658 RepID=UPI00042777DF|nr:alanyl-tRNA editing protein [Peribacillus kribbensis]